MTSGRQADGGGSAIGRAARRAGPNGERYVQEAIEIVIEEHDRTRAERDAFEAFREQVDEVSADRGGRMMSTLRSVAPRTATTPEGLHRVRQAYRDTVMYVDHYEEDYGDTIDESLAEEFGTDLAAQIRPDGSFSPLVKRQLATAAEQCRQERENFLSTLDDERDALEAAQGTLEDVRTDLEHATARLISDFSLDGLISIHSHLEETERRCEALLEERQRQRVDGHAEVDAPRTTVKDLQTYLYQPLAVTYPVLSETTALVARVRRVRERISKELGTRF